MEESTLVKKASGEKEPFSRQKLESSLSRAGADNQVIADILSEVKPWLYDGISTKKIYKKAFSLLTKHRNSIAARYSLKRAIMDLGPTGFPFEHFVGQLLAQFGLNIEVGQVLNGKCVKHEVDVVATGENKQYFVECKFYNSQGKYADVKVPLYIRSRFDDIVEMRKQLPEYANFTFQGWLVTNTRFTTDAMDYGKCSGLHLVSWDYPTGHSLKDLTEREGLFPITVLTFLNKEQKQKLLDDGIVLCQQILKKPLLLDKLGLTGINKEKALRELNDLVG